jgi:N-carbamoylputrescine amidase
MGGSAVTVQKMKSPQQTTRTVRVAAVQVESQPGQIASNHAHALPFIETAVVQGAQLVVLPELFSCGYMPNRSIWHYGETLTGPTVTWLRETSRQLGIYLGAGFLEVAGADFFNSFVLTDPDGKLAGCIRKSSAESYCFKPGAGRHVVETDLGKLGVGICADNHLTPFARLMQGSGIDMLLMPHGSPMPYRTSKTVSEADIDRTVNGTLSLTTLHAELLGVPVVFVNAVGDLQPMAGLLGKFLTPDLFRLRGFSRIADSDGMLVGALGEDEGVLVAEVTLDPARKRRGTPPDHDGWLHEGSGITRKVIIPIDIGVGRTSYALSRQRRRLAIQIAERTCP